jgi:hypothetical protein
MRDPLHASDGGRRGAEAAAGRGSAGGLKSVIEVVLANVSQEIICSRFFFDNPNHDPEVIIDTKGKDSGGPGYRLESQ